MDRALLVMQNLVKLILRLALPFAMRGTIGSPDDIVWLSLSHWVPLATAAVTIVPALPIVIIVAVRKAAVFLFFLVCPMLSSCRIVSPLNQGDFIRNRGREIVY